MIYAINPGGVVALIVVGVLFLFTTVSFVFTRIKKCPPDKIMVISGSGVGKSKDGTTPAKCIHGGAKFIIPVFQQYQYMDLTPISISVDLKQALSKQNIRIDVPSRFTVGISTEPAVTQNAAERLLGLRQSEIQELAKDIIFGQLRLVIATMHIEAINSDRDTFLFEVSKNVESELKKIGLRLINVNVTDITDESGYINALGREATAKAISEARVAEAEHKRNGEIGERRAQAEQRIQVSKAEAEAVEGENSSKTFIAETNALRREKEAESMKRAIVAEKIQEAKAKQEAYSAQEAAEIARANREKATKEADVIVATEIDKRKRELEAEAQAEEIRRIAKGEADAIYLKMEAQARGIHDMLRNQAQGLSEIVKAAGNNPNEAVKLIIADKLEDLVRLQVEAIQNIKIDKVTVWDNGKTENGKTSTANFMAGMMGAVPPLQEIFNSAGLELPKYLGEPIKAEEPKEAKKK